MTVDLLGWLVGQIGLVHVFNAPGFRIVYLASLIFDVVPCGPVESLEMLDCCKFQTKLWNLEQAD